LVQPPRRRGLGIDRIGVRHVTYNAPLAANISNTFHGRDGESVVPEGVRVLVMKGVEVRVGF
jgi:hypothetical protein